MAKTTRTVRYDLNQIPHEYEVEVTHRSEGLELVDSVPEELWTEVRDIVEEAANKTIPKGKKKKARSKSGLSEEALRTAEERREAKSKGERERYIQLNADFQRTAWGDEKDF